MHVYIYTYSFLHIMYNIHANHRIQHPSRMLELPTLWHPRFLATASMMVLFLGFLLECLYHFLAEWVVLMVPMCQTLVRL